MLKPVNFDDLYPRLSTFMSVKFDESVTRGEYEPISKFNLFYKLLYVTGEYA